MSQSPLFFGSSGFPTSPIRCPPIIDVKIGKVFHVNEKAGR
jgi:hypothetical protein